MVDGTSDKDWFSLVPCLYCVIVIVCVCGVLFIVRYSYSVLFIMCTLNISHL